MAGRTHVCPVTCPTWRGFVRGHPLFKRVCSCPVAHDVDAERARLGRQVPRESCAPPRPPGVLLRWSMGSFAPGVISMQ